MKSSSNLMFATVSLSLCVLSSVSLSHSHSGWPLTVAPCIQGRVQTPLAELD